MSELSRMANLYAEMARSVTDTMMSTGRKPANPVEAVRWESDVVRLQSQSSSLRSMSANLRDLDSLVALQSVQEQIGNIRYTVEDANEEIKRLAKVAMVFETVAKILKVGSAVVAFATNPAAGLLSAMVLAVDDLASFIGDKGDA